MPATTRLAGCLAAGLFVAACAGAPGPTGPDPDGTAGPTGPPSTTPPAGNPTPPAGNPTLPPGGGGGRTFPEGAWTGGTLHLVVGGGFNGTFDIALLAYASISTGDATLLTYASEEQTVSAAISIDPAVVAITMTSPDFVGGAGTTTDSPCTASFSRAEANSIEGTLSCSNALLIGIADSVPRSATVQASFSATR